MTAAHHPVRTIARADHPVWAMRWSVLIVRIDGHSSDQEAPMTEGPQLRRDVLPIPDRTPIGLTTYDAKDPATSFPPIEPLRPPEGAPNVLDRPDRRCRLRRVERLRGPDQHAGRRAARDERSQVQPLPHDGALLAHAPGAPDRTEPPRGRHGRDHRDRDLGAGLQLDPPEHVRAARRDDEAERLLDRAVRQVPRGARLGDEPDGPVQRLADGVGASSTSTASSAARRTSTRPRSTATRCRSSSPRRRRRATTSPRT